MNIKKLSHQEWLSVGLSSIALIFSGISLIGILGAAWIFYEQKELPGQPKTPFFLGQTALPADVNLNGNLRDQMAVLQAQIEQLNSAVSHSAVSPLMLAKVNLHCALAELSLGGRIDMAVRFIAEARDELTLAHRSAEATVLDHALASLSLALPAKNGLNTDQQVLNNLKNLENNLSGLAFNLPISQDDFKNSPLVQAQHQPNESTWRSAWEESWARVQSLVVMRNDQTVGEKLISDSAREATVADVLFNLKTAETGVMTGQWVLFQNALNLVNARVVISFQADQNRAEWLSLLDTVQHYPPAVETQLAKNSVEKVLDALAGEQNS